MLATVVDEIVGHSEKMCSVGSVIRRVAPTDSPVVILGESGTGKELVAQAIHRHSKRSAASFIAINCGAVPDNLIESLLFGHQKGSFTGATSDRRGYFEEAHGGTIFLDEFGEMPLQMQVKLLRVLEQGEIVRLGASAGKPIKVDVRVIAATNRDLQRMIADGRFRQDLYYRAIAFKVQLPPLRERREDIPLLAQHLLQKRKQQLAGYEPIVIEEGALELLKTYDWPGNVRELDNVIQQLMVLANQATITPEAVANLLGSTESRSKGTFRLPTDELVVRDNDTMATWVRRAQHVFLTTVLAQYPDRMSAAKRLGLTKNALNLQLSRLRAHRDESVQAPSGRTT